MSEIKKVNLSPKNLLKLLLTTGIIGGAANALTSERPATEHEKYDISLDQNNYTVDVKPGFEFIKSLTTGLGYSSQKVKDLILSSFGSTAIAVENDAAFSASMNLNTREAKNKYITRLLKGYEILSGTSLENLISDNNDSMFDYFLPGDKILINSIDFPEFSGALAGADSRDNVIDYNVNADNLEEVLGELTTSRGQHLKDILVSNAGDAGLMDDFNNGISQKVLGRNFDFYISNPNPSGLEKLESIENTVSPFESKVFDGDKYKHAKFDLVVSIFKSCYAVNDVVSLFEDTNTNIANLAVSDSTEVKRAFGTAVTSINNSIDNLRNSYAESTRSQAVADQEGLNREFNHIEAHIDSLDTLIVNYKSNLNEITATNQEFIEALASVIDPTNTDSNYAKEIAEFAYMDMAVDKLEAELADARNTLYSRGSNSGVLSPNFNLSATAAFNNVLNRDETEGDLQNYVSFGFDGKTFLVSLAGVKIGAGAGAGYAPKTISSEKASEILPNGSELKKQFQTETELLWGDVYAMAQAMLSAKSFLEAGVGYKGLKESKAITGGTYELNGDKGDIAASETNTTSKEGFFGYAKGTHDLGKGFGIGAKIEAEKLTNKKIKKTVGIYVSYN